MGETDDFARALDDGDYKRALVAYRATEHAQSEIGKPTEAFLMALAGDHGAAARAMAGVANANVIESFVRGERERAGRWTDVKKMAAEKANLPPAGGKLVFRDGTSREFSTITDSDDGIGATLETYGADGLLYIPFASLRSVRFHPPRTFLDSFIARADLVLADGTETMVIVPMLYAESTTAGRATIRTGRETTWDYDGPVRRGLGQRDFVLDGGRMIGLQNVAAIELRGVKASPVLPRARIEAGGGAAPVSQKDLLMLLLVLAVIVAVLFVVLS
jgi:hypothetical protein